MKAELDIAPSDIKIALSGFLTRFHVTIYTVLIVGGISIVIFFMYQTIIQSIYPSTTASTTVTNFDMDTIEKLEALSKKSGGDSTISFPSNQRINPFAE